MSDSWINQLPVAVRERVQRRMLSPEAYEKLREKVKGPEFMEREMEKNELMAELKFGLETEPSLYEALKSRLESDLREQGIEQLLDTENIAAESKKLIEDAKFKLTVSPHPHTHKDTLTIVPEGNVKESLPIKPATSDEYLMQFLQASQ